MMHMLNPSREAKKVTTWETVIPWFIVFCLPFIGGCGLPNLDYVTGAVTGEINLLFSMIPIEQGLDDPTLTEEQRNKLDLVIRVRDYAEQTIGLNVGGSYRNFVNLGETPLAWNLTASRKDAIEAYRWTLPFVGSIAYLGYFSKDEAIAERNRLKADGYDTMIYELDAYSTVGLLPDPVTSALLKRDEINLADTVIHELLHNTIWTSTSDVFSESMATFVGRTGAIEFFKAERGPDAEIITEARNSYEDVDKFNAFLFQLRTDLEAVYQNPNLSSEQKIAQREPIFEAARTQVKDDLMPQLHEPDRYSTYSTFPFNNAFMLVSGRYNTSLDVFQQVYENTGCNWAATLDLFRQAATSADPFGFLDQQAKAGTP